MYGKKLSKETILYQIEKQKEFWQNNKELRQSISAKLYKPVIKMNKNNEYIEEYSSAREAGEKNGLSNYSAISNACNGLLKTSCGFKWKWKEK